MERIEKIKAGIDGLLEKIANKSESFFRGQAVGLNYVKELIDNTYPELKESEDERIRKSLVDYFRKFKPQDMWDEMFSSGDVLAYLERQKDFTSVASIQEAYRKGFNNAIEAVKQQPEKYGLQKEQKAEWNIEKAKPGDIVHTGSTASSETFIFKEITPDGNVKCFCSYDSEDGFCEGEYHYIGQKSNKYTLATPEQCISLGRSMGRAGYIWDAKQLKLRKLNITKK